MHFSTTYLITLGMVPVVLGGPAAYALYQSGCNFLAAACYCAVGFAFTSVVAAPATPAVILACNAGLAMCSAACVAVAIFAPAP